MLKHGVPSTLWTKDTLLTRPRELNVTSKPRRKEKKEYDENTVKDSMNILIPF
jgi:hypothetical protein